MQATKRSRLQDRRRVGLLGEQPFPQTAKFTKSGFEKRPLEEPGLRYVFRRNSHKLLAERDHVLKRSTCELRPRNGSSNRRRVKAVRFQAQFTGGVNRGPSAAEGIEYDRGVGLVFPDDLERVL
jgi:hypothetical protein